MQGKMTSLTTGRLTGLRKSSLFFSALEGNSVRVGLDELPCSKLQGIKTKVKTNIPPFTITPDPVASYREFSS
ncbi:hypothetical protein HKBW3S06_00264 [Candidatus Hakubella thermalkaliphila]|uniref:Uncharacterized protein n=1 Tax=Candidatus Hakubella thermalkaliphila TaxID=2754717 RepID=A0A6V8NL87_9ACTN|nr:hypothetical protein [Candidatus Hakubella thermalkaliphila]GFP21038.1 hypothetical protein HKBW3S06_00264 [Candidatus Hakubella thermalkaliphila]